MDKTIILITGLVIFTTEAYSQNTFPDNENKTFEDMLTPNYYLSSDEGSLRNEINKFVYYCQAEQFRHPLEDSTGERPQYSTPPNGEFGAGKGPTGTSQHHAAIDLHVGNKDTNVPLYAAHDGYIRIYRNAQKYRHYLSISKEIKDPNDNVLGKIVTLYAHIDLDLDSADNLLLDGKSIRQGEIVSRHLYSGTVGGPHLHFEIRYYRPGDGGDEGFYGYIGPDIDTTRTALSAGSWSYGYWNPTIGYGFGNPENHLNKSSTQIVKNNFENNIKIFPNPVTDFMTIDLNKMYNDISLSLYNMRGILLYQKTVTSSASIQVNWTSFNKGAYLVQLTDNESNNKIALKAIKR